MRWVKVRWDAFWHRRGRNKALKTAGVGRFDRAEARAYMALAGVTLVLAFLTLDRVAHSVRNATTKKEAAAPVPKEQVQLVLTPVPLVFVDAPAHKDAGKVAKVAAKPAAPVVAAPIAPGPKPLPKDPTLALLRPSPPREDGKEDPEAKKKLSALANDDGWRFFHPAWGRWDKVGQRLVAEPREEDWADVPLELDSLVRDPGDRLEEAFRPPAYLRDRVRFWLGVHVVYNNQMRVLHDRRDPSLVYGHLDFRPIYRLANRAALGDSWAYRLERKVVTELRHRIAEVVGMSALGSSKQTKEEREALRDFLNRHGVSGPVNGAGLLVNLRSQTGQRDEVLAAMRRSRELLPHIETVFRRANLPVALGRIPFVESSFNVRARSKVGAVGIWQFMPATARQYISKDNPQLWADPLRQTQAATRLLRLNKELLPDWSTTVTAYNSGVGRLQRLVKEHRAKNLEPILADNKNGLGFAGKNFYATFLSVNLVDAYRHDLFHRYLDRPELAASFRSSIPFQKQRCEVR